MNILAQELIKVNNLKSSVTTDRLTFFVFCCSLEKINQDIKGQESNLQSLFSKNITNKMLDLIALVFDVNVVVKKEFEVIRSSNTQLVKTWNISIEGDNIISSGGVMTSEQRNYLYDFIELDKMDEILLKSYLLENLGINFNQRILNYATNVRNVIKTKEEVYYLINNISNLEVTITTLKVLAQTMDVEFHVGYKGKLSIVGRGRVKVYLYWRSNGLMVSISEGARLNLVSLKNFISNDFPITSHPSPCYGKWIPVNTMTIENLTAPNYLVTQIVSVSDVLNYFLRDIMSGKLSDDQIIRMNLFSCNDDQVLQIQKLINFLDLRSHLIYYSSHALLGDHKFKLSGRKETLHLSEVYVLKNKAKNELFMMDNRNRNVSRTSFTILGVGYSDLLNLITAEYGHLYDILVTETFIDYCLRTSTYNIGNSNLNKILTMLDVCDVNLRVYKSDNIKNFKDGSVMLFRHDYSLFKSKANVLNICISKGKYYKLSTNISPIHGYKVVVNDLISTPEIAIMPDYNQTYNKINDFLPMPIKPYEFKDPITFRANIDVHTKEFEINMNDDGTYRIFGSYWLGDNQKNIDHTCSYEDLTKLQHDWSMNGYMTSTDVKLYKAELANGDDFDNKSPDYILMEKEDDLRKFHILEIGSVVNPSNAASEFLTKKAKYEAALVSRTENITIKRWINFSVLIVTPTSIMTNLKLPDNVKRNIIEQYIIGRYMKEVAMNKQIINETSDYMASRLRHIEGIFKSIKEFEGDELLPNEVLNEIKKPFVIDDKIRSEHMLDDIWNEEFSNISEKFIKDFGESENPILLKYKVDLMHHVKKEEEQNSRSSRIDLKAIVQLPLLVPEIDGDFSNHLDLPNQLNDNTPESRIWHSAIDNYSSLNRDESVLSEFERICLPVNEQFEYNESIPVKEYRRNRGSTKPYISEYDSIHFAKVGVNAKKFLDMQEIKDYRSAKKESFKIYTNTIDVDKIINSLDLYDQVDLDNRNSDILVDLIQEAMNIHGAHTSTKQHISLVKSILSTKLGRFCTFVSDLGQEIAISINQNCAQNEFRLKKLSRFKDVFLLIRPTCKSGKIFYSLLFKKAVVIESTVFKKFIDCGNGWCCTEFVSDSISKLVNKTRCESILISIFISYCEIYQVDSYNTTTVSKLLRCNTSIGKMTTLAILILLEDKHATEEAITLHRYIHMESMVELPAMPHPSKMFEKLNLNIKSRLELWIYHRTKLLIKHYSETPCFVMNNKLREWNNFANPFIILENGELEIVNHDHWLNTAYLGYLKNKDETPENNVSGKLISKIVERENELPLKPDGTIDFTELGMSEPDECTGHKFSPSFIRYICQEAKERIIKQTNCKDYDEYMTECILKKLSNESINSLATLKASSVYSKDLYNYDRSKEIKRISKTKVKQAKIMYNINRKDKLKEFLESSTDPQAKDILDALIEEKMPDDKSDTAYHRIRMIQFVINRLKEYPESYDCSSICTLIPKSLENLEKDKCLHIDIFKKNQHAGLREIYVLTGDGRIVQKCIEDIARAIMYHFEEETMTHPKSKYLLSEMTNAKCAKEFGNFFRMCTSDDAAKWNQYHTVSKFILMFLQLTPKLFHPFIIRVLRLWFDKRIKIGDDLLKLFNFCQMTTHDKWVQAAYDAYNGRRNDIVWMDKGISHIKTKSGMMQGILHYTSSLLHVCYLSSLKTFLLKKLQHMMRFYIGIDSKVQLTNIMFLVSSDDSLMNIYFPLSTIDVEGKYMLLCKLLSLASFNLKTRAGERLAIHKSIKSTTLTRNMHEFNSDFYYNRSQRKPTLRWVNASLIISEQSNLNGRQEEMSNTLTSILEGGGTIHQTSICQISQALLFYRIMGSSISQLWPLYQVIIKFDKDPSSGLFLMDSPLLAGLAGFKYNMWVLCKKTKYNIKLNHLLEKMKEGPSNIEKEDEALNKADILRGLAFSYSGGFKYQRLLDNVEYDANCLDVIQEDPGILFRPSDTPKDVILQCYIKLRSPGVRESLSSTNMIAKEMASSVYILTRPVLYTHSAVIKEIANSTNTNKISLFSYMVGATLTMYGHNPVLRQKSIWLQGCNKVLDTSYYTVACNLIRSECHLEKDIDRLKLVLTYIDNFNHGTLTEDEKLRLVCSYMNRDIVLLEEIESHDLGSLCLTKRYYNFNEDSYPICIIYNLDYSYSVNNSISVNDLRLRNFQRQRLPIDRELFLFPMSPEYHKLSHDSLGFEIKGILAPKKNTRDKTRLNFEVITKETMSNTQLVSILKYKWFGYTTKNISINILETAFEEIKKTFSWIKDTIDETLKASPFETYLQLFWFISRDPYRSRVVHLNGAYMQLDNIKLRTLISLNFSDALSSVDISKIQDRENRPVRELLHILSGLTTLPICDSKKLFYLMDVLYNYPQIISNYNERDRNIARLSILQRFIKTNPNISCEYYTGLSEGVLKKMTQDRVKLSPEDAIRILNTTKIDTENLSSDDLDVYMESSSVFNAIAAEKLHIRTIYNDNELDIESDEDIIGSLIENSSYIDINLELMKTYINKSGFFHLLYDPNKNQDDLNNTIDEFSRIYTDTIRTLKDHNLGVFGYYIKPQKFNRDKRIYYGEGVWQGVMGYTKIKIYIDSEFDETYLKSITVDKETHLMDLMYNLKKWCEDTNVIMKDLEHNESLNAIAKIRNGEIVRSKENGIPITIDQDMMDIEVINMHHIKIELSHTGIRLVARETDSSRDITLLSIPLHKWYFHPNIAISSINLRSYNLLPPLIKNYLEFKVHDNNKAFILEICNALENPHRVCKDKAILWIKDLYKTVKMEGKAYEEELIIKTIKQPLNDAISSLDKIQNADELNELISKAINNVVAFNISEDISNWLDPEGALHESVEYYRYHVQASEFRHNFGVELFNSIGFHRLNVIKSTCEEAKEKGLLVSISGTDLPYVKLYATLFDIDPERFQLIELESDIGF